MALRCLTKFEEVMAQRLSCSVGDGHISPFCTLVHRPLTRVEKGETAAEVRHRPITTETQRPTRVIHQPNFEKPCTSIQGFAFLYYSSAPPKASSPCLSRKEPFARGVSPWERRRPFRQVWNELLESSEQTNTSLRIFRLTSVFLSCSRLQTSCCCLSRRSNRQTHYATRCWLPVPRLHSTLCRMSVWLLHFAP